MKGGSEARVSGRARIDRTPAAGVLRQMRRGLHGAQPGDEVARVIALVAGDGDSMPAAHAFEHDQRRVALAVPVGGRELVASGRADSGTLLIAISFATKPADNYRRRRRESPMEQWSKELEEAFQKFKRHFEEYREIAGEEELRSSLAGFRMANEHHSSMLPILDRLERELLGE